MENDIRSNRILYAILCDVRVVSRRIITRKDDYISIFALKRTREHFERIFRSKFDQTTVELLSYCPENIIELFYRFHDHCEKLKWYLIYTEDMPNAIGENIARDIHLISSTYKELETQIEEIIYSQISQGDENFSVESLPPVPATSNDGIILEEELELDE